MKNNFSSCLLTVLTAAALATAPVRGFADGKLLTGGIIAIEKDVTYLTPLGLQDGAQKNDIAQILRGERKVAEVRLISVLSSSSVAEVVKLFNADGIQENDSIMLLSAAAKEAISAASQSVTTSQPERPFVVDTTEVPLPDPEVKAATVASQRKELEQLREDHQAELLQKDKIVQQRLKNISSDMDQLQAQVMEKDSVIDSLKIQMEKLKKDLTARDDRLGELKLEMDDLNRKLDAAQKALQQEQVAHSTRVTQMQEEQSQQLIKKDNAAQERLVSQEAEYKNQIVTLRGQIDGLTEDKTKIVDQLNSKESMVKALMEERARLRGEVDGLNARITQLIEEHTADFLKQDQDHQKKFRAMSEDLQTKVSVLQGEIEVLKRNSQASTEQLQNELAQKQAQIADLQREQDSLQVDLMVREQKISDANAEINQLRDALKSLDEKVNSSESDLSNARAEADIQIGALQKALKDKEILIDGLKQEKETLAGGVKTRDEQLKALMDQAQKLRDDLKSAQNKFELMQSDVDAFKAKAQSQIADLQNDLKNKQALSAVVSKEKETLIADVKSREAQLAALNEQLQLLRTQTKSAQETSDQQIVMLKAEIAKRADTITGLNKDKEALAVEIKDREQKISDLNSSLDELAAALKQTQDQLESTRTELGAVNTSAKVQAATLQSDLDQTKAMVETLTKDKDALIAELKGQDQKLADVTLQARQLADELKKTQDSAASHVTTLKDELVKTRLILDAVSQDKNALLADLKVKEQTLDDLKLETQQTYEALKKAKDEVAALQGQIASLKTDSQAQVTMLRADIEKKDTMFVSLNKESEKLSAALKDREQKLAAVSVDADKLRKDLKTAQDQAAAFDKQLGTLKEFSQTQIAILQADLDKKNTLLDGMTQQKEALSEGLKDKMRQLQDAQMGAEKIRADLKKSQDRVTALEGELSALKIKTQSELAGLKAELDKRDSVIAAINKEKDAIAAAIKDKDKKISEAQSAADKAREDLKRIQENADKNSEILKMAVKDQKNADERIKALEKDKQSLIKSLQEKDQKLSDATSKLQQLTDEAKKMRGSVDSQVLALKTELEQKDALLDSFNKGKTLLTDDIKDKDQKLEELNAKLQRVQADADKAREKTASLESELNILKSSAQSEAAILKSELDKRQVLLDATGKEKLFAVGEVKARDEKIAELSAVIEQLRADVKKAQDQSASLTKELGDVKLAAQNDKTALKSDLDKKEALLDVLGRDKTSFMADVKERDQKILDLTASVQDLRTQLKTAQDQSAVLSKELIDVKLAAQNDKTALKIELDKRDAMLDVLGKDKAAFLSELKERDQKFTDVNVMAEKLRSQLKTAQDQSAALNEELQSVRNKSPKELDALKEEIAKRDRELKSLSQDHDDLRSQLKKAQDQSAALNEELQSVRNKSPKELDALREEIAKKDRDVKSLNQSQDDLRAQLKKAQDQSAALNEELQSVKNKSPKELDAWKEEAARKERDIKSLKEERDGLSVQLKSSQSKLEDLRDQLAQLKANPPADQKLAQVQEEFKRQISEKESRIKVLTDENAWLKQNVDKLNQLLIHLNNDSTPLYRKEASAPISKTSSAASAPAVNQTRLENWQDYYAGIRKMILGRLGEADLSAYVGKAGTVEVEFEVLANGSLKNDLKFRGTNDPALKKILEKCFHKASPFPKFPVNLTEESKIFTIVIEF